MQSSAAADNTRIGKKAARLGFAALAALGLAGTPASAQTSLFLNSGDDVSVTGAGTSGRQNGQVVVTPTAAYSNADGHDAVQTYGTANFALGPGGTLTATHSGYTLDAEGSGRIQITGGVITATQSDSVALSVIGSGPATITGGSIVAGLRGIGVDAEGGPVFISGGSVSTGDGGYGVYTFNGGAVTITGGTFMTTGSGGTGLFADNRGVFNLFSLPGTLFSINGMAVSNGTLGQYTSGTDHITGTLANSQILDTTFVNNGTFNLNVGAPPASAAPEPAAAAVWTLIGLGAAALALHACRRRAA